MKIYKMNINFNQELANLLENSFICPATVDTIYLIELNTKNTFKLMINPQFYKDSTENIIDNVKDYLTLVHLPQRQTLYSRITAIYFKFKVFIFGITQKNESVAEVYSEINNNWIDLTNSKIRSVDWKYPISFISKFSIFVIDRLNSLISLEYDDEIKEFKFKTCKLDLHDGDINFSQNDFKAITVALKEGNLIEDGTEFNCVFNIYTQFGSYCINSSNGKVEKIQASLCNCFLRGYKFLLFTDNEGSYEENGYRSICSYIDRGLKGHVKYFSYYTCICKENITIEEL